MRRTRMQGGTGGALKGKLVAGPEFFEPLGDEKRGYDDGKGALR